MDMFTYLFGAGPIQRAYVWIDRGPFLWLVPSFVGMVALFSM